MGTLVSMARGPFFRCNGPRYIPRFGDVTSGCKPANFWPRPDAVGPQSRGRPHLRQDHSRTELRTARTEIRAIRDLLLAALALLDETQERLGGPAPQSVDPVGAQSHP